MRACGPKTIDIAKLKSITTYSRCTADSEIIQRFWRVFEKDFTEEERQAYLKFVWGRSRLPMDVAGLSHRHHIVLLKEMNPRAFPKAHTCFF